MRVRMTMGEKLKDLRVERGLTTKQLCKQTGISEAVYNGMENDANRDTGYSRIIALARFYDVPTDYLLGFTQSRITKNIDLKEMGLSDDAIKVLLNKKQSNALLSDLIEHEKFPNLINSIDVYVRQLAAPNISSVNNMLKIAQRGIENYYSDDKQKPEDYDSAMNYMNETVVNEDDFLRFRISERFNQILRDVFSEYKERTDELVSKRTDSINQMTGDILTVLDKIKHEGLKLNSPLDAIRLMMGQMNVSEDEVMDAAEELFGEVE